MSVSLAMIVRDEEKNLPCLAEVARLVDEIVIVDTGSVDATKAVAAALRDRDGKPARVFDFAWCDDFSAARNEALRHATQEWILWLDADDRIADLRKLQGLFVIAERRHCFLFEVVSPPETVRQPRLFPRLPGVVWERRIHEDVLPSLARLGIQQVNIDITIEHAGYLDAERNEQRHGRNLRLLQMQLAESPGDPWTLYYLGVQHCWGGDVSEAIRYLQACLAAKPNEYLRDRCRLCLGRAYELRER